MHSILFLISIHFILDDVSGGEKREQGDGKVWHMQKWSLLFGKEQALWDRRISDYADDLEQKSALSIRNV